VTIRSAVTLISLLGLMAIGAEGQARVQVHVTDALGSPVPPQSLKLTAEDGTTIEARQDEVLNLKYGRYAVDVTAQGFSNAARNFLVDQPQQILSITMKLGTMEVPLHPCSIAGRIVPKDGVRRIRLLELFGSYLTDVPVVDGAFRFQNLECGDYMLIVMSSKRCLATMMSHATMIGSNVDIRLPELGGGACDPAN
jgi:hypothetical protein